MSDRMTMKRGDTDPIRYRVNADVTAATLRFLVRSRPDSGDLVAIIPTSAGLDGTETVVTVPVEAINDTAGSFYVELEATQAGTVLTFPSSGYSILIIEADLG